MDIFIVLSEASSFPLFKSPLQLILVEIHVLP
jgi:hypothetical protein